MGKENLTIQNTTKKKNKLYTSTKILLVVGCLILIPFIIYTIYLMTPEGKGRWHNSGADVIIDDVKWTVNFQQHSYTQNIRITQIKSSSSYNERTSEYYTMLATRYGSADVFVIHEVSKVGKAIDNETFLIEETEVIKNGFDENEILHTKTTSYKESLPDIYSKVIEKLSNPTS